MSSSFSAPCSIPLLIAQLESSSSHSPSSARRPPPVNSRRVSNVACSGLAAPPSTPVEIRFGRRPPAIEDPHVVVPVIGGLQHASLAEESLRTSLVRSSRPSCASPMPPPAPLPASSVQVYTLPGFVPAAYVLRSSVRMPLIVHFRENSVTVELRTPSLSSSELRHCRAHHDRREGGLHPASTSSVEPQGFYCLVSLRGCLVLR